MHSNKVQTIIERVKWHSKNLNVQEKEMLRDELISLMLFSTNDDSSFSNHNAEQTFQGLTDEEKALIQKLAEQAEQLHRLSRGDDKKNS